MWPDFEQCIICQGETTNELVTAAQNRVFKSLKLLGEREGSDGLSCYSPDDP